MKLGSCIQDVAKDCGQTFYSRSLVKNGDQLNENLSWETILLATTLSTVESQFFEPQRVRGISLKN